MSIATVLAVSLLAAASQLAAVDVTSAPPAGSTGAADAVPPAGFTNSALSPAAPAPAPAPARETQRPNVVVGARAPDFQYQSYDAMWQHLHNVLEHGDVLLVFGASDVDLRTLERERESLVKTGVVPLVVVEKNDRDVWASVRRLGLTFSLLADPRGAIGSQYGVYDPSVGRSRSAWFVIDVKRRIRQFGGDLPSQGWPATTAQALGRPQAGSTQAASKR